MSSILPILGLYALAGYKLLPAFQQVYAAMSQLKFTAPAIENLHNEFLKKQEGKIVYHQRISFNSDISLKNVSYYYPSSKVNALDNTSIQIRAKQKVALVGQSGSGKSTALDIIMGLLLPVSEENNK